MANPPITIGPFDNVPAPGSPIRSDWPQEAAQWIAAVDAGIPNTLLQAFTTDNMALNPTTPWNLALAVTCPARPYPRLAVLTMSALPAIVSGTPTTFDLWLQTGGSFPGTARRARTVPGSTATIAITYPLGVNQGGTVQAGLSIGSGASTATAVLAGGSALNFLSVALIPLVHPAVSL